MEAVKALLKDNGLLMVLIKPQFEAEKHEIGRGGIIKDSTVHTRVVEKVISGIEGHGFKNEGIIDSPILGAQGNKEFIGLFKRI